MWSHVLQGKVSKTGEVFIFVWKESNVLHYLPLKTRFSIE